ncbi:hypothetical protein [Glaciimonas soli]|uniref:Alpha/beta hydrolase n=1 Tax=Glaciimonas soli TaxID=2590999 RepID=A0A843YMW0_9BURK|nr:hypothetical protein [Glaciimonas soli]MQR00805.1 hypothetical protein [Glaciimonas soli]
MTVKKRHVFYISGFDPRGAAFYRLLYQREAAKQCAVGGLNAQVGPRRRSSDISSSWQIQSGVGDQRTAIHYEFLHWDDIVRAHWVRDEIQVLAAYLRAFWIYLSSGALSRVLKASWPPFVTALFPLAILLTVLGLASGAAVGAYQLIALAEMPWWVGAIAGLGAFGLLIQGGRLLERRMNSYWLLRIYAFSAQQGLGNLPDLDARLNEMARHIVAKASNSDADEILIVGHSTGTIMATIVLARALAIDPELLQQQRSRISLLTLGQCIPIVSLLPQAQQFRDALSTLAQAEKLDWIDFTAPTDGACFALVDPIAVSGISQVNPDEPKPKLLSPRFARLFAPATYAKIRRNWYRTHFQYVMASEKAGEYDYFAITAGHLTLAERHQSLPSVQHYKRPKVFS